MPGWRHSTSSSARGYGAAWNKLRSIVLKRARYLCQCSECSKLGRVRTANEVDHIVPKWQGGTDDLSNLQAINTDCHKRKTQVELGHKTKTPIGVDGWPKR